MNTDELGGEPGCAVLGHQSPRGEPHLLRQKPLPSPPPRVSVDGKFFRLGAAKFFAKGLTYGPFAPNAAGEMFPEPEQARRDLAQIQGLGANVLRLYYVPPPWFLDLAARHGLRLLVDVPWPKHLCFLESYEVQQQARAAVRQAAQLCRGHPALLALSVANEIPPEVVRWSDPKRVAAFIDELVDEAKAVDPEVLCTFASFPPTEFLLCRKLDFVCFNVYLHRTEAFAAYLARLQMLADTKPLLLGEFGMDSLREGEERKCQFLREQLITACRAGLAGTVVFSYTDDWFRGGQQIEDWQFGLTTRQREPKASFAEVRRLYAQAPYFPEARSPRVSVVVASYNGARTLDTCLASLTRLNYPDYEVILVDDGSTDNTQEIARRYPTVRNIQQTNRGLSAARNAGIEAATGEIVAFTDSDCRADEDWLYYLVGDLLRGEFTGIGGHNFLPPEDSPVAAAVLVSPGGPAHVMLTDTEAEHIPGCNMAFYKWALDEIKGFDPIYRKAGDDVDVCWRLQERGYRIGFSPAGFVWHYRRSTVKAYLKQQGGYGEAEALLLAKHPQRFNALGGGRWQGRIYAAAHYGLLLQRSVIYHGIFGSGFFQKLYAPPPAHALMLCTSLEYHALVNLPLLALSLSFPLLRAPALTAVAASVAICIAAAFQAPLPADKLRFWSLPLVAWLFFLQPIVRGWVRYRTRLNLEFRPEAPGAAARARLAWQGSGVSQLCFWSRQGLDRLDFLRGLLVGLERRKWERQLDSGWERHDVEVVKSRWAQLRLTTVGEHLGTNRCFIRCRVTARWSVLARIAFVTTVLALVLLINNLVQVFPWIWLSLPLLPLMAWFFDDECAYHRGLLLESVEQTASELKLEAYHPEAGARAAAPAAG